MISLARLEEPDILKRKKDEWTAKYLQKISENAGEYVRPNSSQYAHKGIVGALRSMARCAP